MTAGGFTAARPWQSVGCEKQESGGNTGCMVSEKNGISNICADFKEPGNAV
jgi:hypothetical protein